MATRRIPEPSFGRFSLRLPVAIRRAEAHDLADLEWFGLYTPHREVMDEAYRRQECGDGLLLVADGRGFPVGQLWVDLVRKRAESIGVIWAVRVIPCLRRFGIGTRLMKAAERFLKRCRVATAELAVEKHNLLARRLYERLGYRVVGESFEEHEYDETDGTSARRVVDQWLMQKAVCAQRAPPPV